MTLYLYNVDSELVDEFAPAKTAFVNMKKATVDFKADEVLAIHVYESVFAPAKVAYIDIHTSSRIRCFLIAGLDNVTKTVHLAKSLGIKVHGGW